MCKKEREKEKEIVNDITYKQLDKIQLSILDSPLHGYLLLLPLANFETITDQIYLRHARPGPSSTPWKSNGF